jgi:hypothetical protein
MKINSNKVFYRIILFVSFLYGFQAFADPPVPSDCGGAPCPPDDDIPINENITLLIIIAIIFGIYVIYNHQQNKKTLA